MESLQPAARLRPRRSSTGWRVLLATLLGCAAWPSGALAGPLEDAVQRTHELAQPATQAVETQVQAVAPAVAPTVEAVRSTEPVRSVVQTVTADKPVRTAVERVAATPAVRSAIDTVRAPVAAVRPGVAPAATGSVDRVRRAAPAPASPARTVARKAPREAGRIGGASTRAGGDEPSPGALGALSAFAAGVTAPASLLATAASELPRTAASSIATSGDDSGDGGQPLFGPNGGSDLLGGGPGGIALIALGLLLALLTLVPRFSSRLLHMSSTRWGSTAFHVRIERPG
jgi:hypothetical protein